MNYWLLPPGTESVCLSLRFKEKTRLICAADNVVVLSILNTILPRWFCETYP